MKWAFRNAFRECGPTADIGMPERSLRHSDVTLTLQFYTHAVSRDRMVAVGENVDCDSQPCTRQKRTESGLNRKTVRDKFFGEIDVCVGPFAPLSRSGLRADGGH